MRDRARDSADPEPSGGAAAGAALRDVEASIRAAWDHHVAAHPGTDPGALAREVLRDPSRHPWRLVDAALDRQRCEACGGRLGTGARGCEPCDLADGFRFAAREPDGPGVPPGNEHAIRVATAVLRSPGRYPAWAVASNERFLPLFLAGRMPTRAEQERMLAASRAGASWPEPGVAHDFAELTRLLEERRPG